MDYPKLLLFVASLMRCLFTTSLAYYLDSTIIMPWVDSYDETPNVTLYVCYREDSCVKNGDTFALNDTIDGPYVTFIGLNLNKNDEYVYICVDVDEYNPQHPYAKNEVHWLVSNIPGSIRPYEREFYIVSTICKGCCFPFFYVINPLLIAFK